MVKNSAWLLAPMFICLTLSGCWDIKEVKDLGIAVASGIDAGEHKIIKSTMQISMPSGGAGKEGQGQSKDNFSLIAGEANTVRQLVPVLQERSDRNLYYSHRSIILIGEDMAKRGIEDVLDQFIREPTNRTRALVMIVREDTARHVLEKASGQLIEKTAKQNPGVAATLHDFLIAQLGEGGNPVTGAVELIPRKRESRKYTRLRLSYTAVFKDMKLAGYLNEKETIGLLWITGRFGSRHGFAKVPSHGRVALQIGNTERKVEPSIDHGQVKVKIELKGSGQIIENNTDLDLLDDKALLMIEKAMNIAVKQDVEKAIRHAKEMGTDVFGFGTEIYRNSPRKWKKIKKHWSELFRECTVTVKVDIKPVRTGAIGPASAIKEEEIKKPSEESR